MTISGRTNSLPSKTEGMKRKGVGAFQEDNSEWQFMAFDHPLMSAINGDEVNE
ncbi:hypothetical protein [Brevibacterium luteolum]|uniref:hypothetical protein n=1 Tax=Brevibacterium luteolum TaxID=199591 RepID=UPI003B67D8EE